MSRSTSFSPNDACKNETDFVSLEKINPRFAIRLRSSGSKTFCFDIRSIAGMFSNGELFNPYTREIWTPEEMTKIINFMFDRGIELTHGPHHMLITVNILLLRTNQGFVFTVQIPLGRLSINNPDVLQILGNTQMIDEGLRREDNNLPYAEQKALYNSVRSILLDMARGDYTEQPLQHTAFAVIQSFQDEPHVKAYFDLVGINNE
jgi:hypothetical protein